MSDKQLLNEYYDPEEDMLDIARASSTRRPRLTLRHLNKLRKVKELREMELAAHRTFVKDMYGSSAADEGEEF